MATRKRNRDREEPPRPNVCTASDPAGFSTFKVEPHAPSKHIFSEAEGTRIVTEWILFRRVFVTKFLFITVVKFQHTNNGYFHIQCGKYPKYPKEQENGRKVVRGKNSSKTVAQRTGRIEQGGRRKKAGKEVSRTQNWMTFRSAHTALFMYLHLIVLLDPSNVTITVREKR